VLPAGFGRFTSYANTYASPAAFDAANPLDPVTRVWVESATGEVRELTAQAQLTEAILRLDYDNEEGDGLPATNARAGLEGFLPSDATRVTITEHQRRFNWETGEFYLGADARIVRALDLQAP
jgi:hypothetical protein